MLLREILAAARIELLEPRPQKPSYRQLLHWAVGVTQSVYNRLSNTGSPWMVGETTLETSANQTEYVLPSTVGRILDVTTNYDPENGEYEYQVPFYAFNDMSEGWQEGWGYAGAQRIAFYRKNGQLYARVRPMPTDSKTFRVAYSVGSWAADMGLDDSPVLNEHHHLITAKLAYKALPAASWFDDEDENRTRRNELRGYLSEQIGELDKDFNLSVVGLTTPRSHQRVEAFPIE